jgi:hypothetical protein
MTTVALEKLRKALVILGLIEEDISIERTRFRLEILEVSCSPCLRVLKEYLQNEMQGVDGVSLYAISPGKFTLDIAFRGEIETFGHVLTSMPFEDFRLDLEGMDENHLRVVMVLTYSQEG